MGLKGFLHLKLQGLRLRRLVLIGNGKRNKKKSQASKKKPSWMTSFSHGYHVVETKWFRGELESGESEYDSVVVQREQVDDGLELWFFEISDARIGDGVVKLVQSHFFDQKPKRQIRSKSKEAMRKAYIGVREKEKEKNETLISKIGSVCAMVINGEKLVIANIGDYKAVLCRDGVAHSVNSKSKRRRRSTKRFHWARRLITGCQSQTADERKSTPYNSPELVVGVGTERVDYFTEFLILASTGIWEKKAIDSKALTVDQVMKAQEAVDLISHLEDPQEAAECLAREAIHRLSKTNISCLVIRFD